MDHNSERSRLATGWRRDLIPARWRPGVERFKVGIRWTFAGLLVASAVYFLSLFLSPNGTNAVDEATPVFGLGQRGLPVIYVLLTGTTSLWLGAAWLVAKQRYVPSVRLLQPGIFLLFALMEIWHVQPGSELRSVAPLVFWFFTLAGLATGIAGVVQMKKGETA